MGAARPSFLALITCAATRQNDVVTPKELLDAVMSKNSNERKPSAHDTLAEELKRYIQLFRADGSQSFRLKSQKTDETGGLDKQTASETIERNRLRLAEMQERLYDAGHWRCC